MDDTLSPPEKQAPVPAARNFPAKLAEAEQPAAEWPQLLIHRGRRVETIGRTLQRLIDHEPDPLPDGFFGRFAASVAANPVAYGRLFMHALQEVGNDG